MATSTLSHGALAPIKAKGLNGDAQPIVLRVENMRKNDKGKYALMIGDGTTTMQCGLGAALQQMCEDGAIAKNCYLKLTNYMVNKIANQQVIILKAAEVALSAADAPALTGPAVKMEKLKTKTSPATPQASTPLKQTTKRNTPCSLPRAAAGSPAQPIKSLNPYQSRWTIKARVTNKSEIKRWNNARGEGQLFSVHLLDSEGTEIRATFFREAVDKFFEEIHEEQVYTFAKGRLKVANSTYTSIKNNYEITFGADAIIMQSEEDATIQKMKFNFVPLDKLMATAPNSTIDIIGVVHNELGLQSLNAKDGRALQKRDLVMVDTSGNSVRCTLWGEKANMPDSTFAGQPVLALKGCKLSDYGGRSIGTYQSTSAVFNPPCEETQALQSWYADEGQNATFVSLSSGEGGGGGSAAFDKRKTLAAITEENLGYGEKPDYVNVKVTVTAIKHDRDVWYPACPEEGNNKKLIEKPDGTWFCESTNQSYEKPEYRWILPLSVTDSTANSWVTLFNDQAISLLGGTKADTAVEKKEIDAAGYESLFEKGRFQDYIMRMRVKADTYNDQTRVRVTCMRLTPLSYSSECKNLVKAIDALLPQ